jgi:hypothetical protein
MKELSDAVSSAKTLFEIVKANKSLISYNELVVAVSEVNTKLMSATDAVFTGYEKQALLNERIRELEKTIMEFENWEREINKYKLHKFETGTLAYILKPDMENSEPSHYICEGCANTRKKSRMQPDGDGNFLRCHKCKLLIPITEMSPAFEKSIKSRMNM